MNRDDDGKFTGRQEDLQMSEEYTVEFGRAVEFHMMMASQGDRSPRLVGEGRVPKI